MKLIIGDVEPLERPGIERKTAKLVLQEQKIIQQKAAIERLAQYLHQQSKAIKWIRKSMRPSGNMASFGINRPLD